MTARGRAGRPRGTQTIERTVRLLRLIAAHDRGGVALGDLAHHAGFSRPTVHRMLKCLCDEGVVAQDPVTRRYRLGHLLFELGLAAAPRVDLAALCQPALIRIAQRTGDTAFLSVRSGYDAVCIGRQEGAFPIRTLLLEIGTRRPLGAGAGGIALLAPLADEAVREVAQANAPRFKAFAGLTPTRLLTLVKRARETGYALNDLHFTPGALSIALPIRDRARQPIAAISIGAIESRMTPPRQRELAALLGAEIEALERLVAEAMAP